MYTAALDNMVHQWGLEDIHQIDTAFWIPARGLYADKVMPGKHPPPDNPAFMWGCGVHLSALVAAAYVNRTIYLPKMQRFIAALERYWITNENVSGYGTLPNSKSVDRFYDDNAWMVLNLVDAYDLTHDEEILTKARQTFRFVMTGEDETLGGGIYWHEQERNSKNTCSNAPSIVAALRLYQCTRDLAYFVDACRLYAWTHTNLQDKDGLFMDRIVTDGMMNIHKWSYNSALMIRANAIFYQILQQQYYLTEAQRIARAAESHWVNSDTGAIADDASFAHLLSEAFLFLYDQDHDPHHLVVVQRALTFLHFHARDAAGTYGKRWETPRQPGELVRLLAVASAARANLIAGTYFSDPKQCL